MRVKITQQGVSDAPQAVCPGFQAGLAVDAQTQDLGLDPIEPVKCSLVRRDLARSDRRPGQWEEGQDQVLFPKIITGTDGLSEMAFQTDFWSELSFYQYHSFLL